MFKSVKEFRIEKGITQDQLAEKSGISQAMISMVEKGEAKAGMETWEALAKVLGVDKMELIFGQILEKVGVEESERKDFIETLVEALGAIKSKDFEDRDSFGRKKATKEKEKDRDSFGRKKSLGERTRDQLGYRREN